MAKWALPVIDKEKCVLCGECVSACPHNVLEISVDTLTFINPQQCTYCGICEDQCPHEAVVCFYEISWAKPINEENP